MCIRAKRPYVFYSYNVYEYIMYIQHAFTQNTYTRKRNTANHVKLIENDILFAI